MTLAALAVPLVPAGTELSVPRRNWDSKALSGVFNVTTGLPLDELREILVGVFSDVFRHEHFLVLNVRPCRGRDRQHGARNKSSGNDKPTGQLAS